MSNFISLSQAAKEWEVSKGTISTAIKRRALPTKGKTPQGGYKIDKADFLVWYNNDYQNPNKTRSTELNKTVQANSNEPLQNSILEAELKAEREMKKFYKEQHKLRLPAGRSSAHKISYTGDTLCYANRLGNLWACQYNAKIWLKYIYCIMIIWTDFCHI